MLQAAQRAAGAALLRALADECSSRRLLQSLGAWGASALAALRATSEDAARAALLAVLQSLFWRVHQLLELPGVRQEGAALAGRLAVYLRPSLQPDAGGPFSSGPPRAACILRILRSLEAKAVADSLQCCASFTMLGSSGSVIKRLVAGATGCCCLCAWQQRGWAQQRSCKR